VTRQGWPRALHANTALEDLTTPPGVLPRGSIELLALMFFP
jgi:hypothetical protein